MRAVPFLLAIVLLTACTSAPTSNQPDNPAPAPSAGTGYRHTAEEAEQFIRRFEGLSVGLVNYFHPGRVELVSREFSAETVVFRLNSTGDTGEFHTASVDLATDLAIKLWEHTAVGNEVLEVSHLATIRISSIGVPANSKAGDTIPVKIELKGDASDIHGGYIYTTPLRNKLGRTVAVLREGYLPFSLKDMPEDQITPDQRADAENLQVRQGATGPWFLLRKGVQLAADVTADDLTSDQIILPLVREVPNDQGGTRIVRSITADMIPDVMDDITRQMAESGSPVKVEHAPGRLIVTPLGVRELSLRQVYERVEQLRVEVKPRNNLIIVFDNQLHRVAIYGPTEQRFLIDHVMLSTDPFTRDKPGGPFLLPFRVSCRVLEKAERGNSGKFGIPDARDVERGITPDGHQGRVRLTWSKWKDGRMVSEGAEEMPTTDLSEVLRRLWVLGMGPLEVLGFVQEADNSFAINAELGLNYQKTDLERLESNDGQG